MRTLIISVFTLLLFACGQDEFESYLIPKGTDDIIEVSLHPNSPVLMADGKAELTFRIRAYTEVDGWQAVAYTVDGATLVRDSLFTDTVALNTDRIPADRIRITAANGDTVNGLTYSTTAAAGEVTFTCQIGNITSAPCRVQLIKPELPSFTPRTIPVVFHLMYTSNSKSIAEGVDEQFVTEVLDRLNRVFAGTYAPAPSYLDTKMTFEPLEMDDKGMQLEEKGIHRVDVSSVKNDTIKKYIMGVNSVVLWKPEEILNIWVYEISSGKADSKGPKYVLDNGTEIPGLTLSVLSDPSAAKISDPTDVGIVMPISTLFSSKRGASLATRFEYLFGKFFGLLDTQETGEGKYNGTDTDYCSDTYVPRYGMIGVTKRTAVVKGSTEEPVYYNSYNIMESASASTTISYEQALRIRKVMENCPLRMMQSK